MASRALRNKGNLSAALKVAKVKKGKAPPLVDDVPPRLKTPKGPKVQEANLPEDPVDVADDLLIVSVKALSKSDLARKALEEAEYASKKAEAELSCLRDKLKVVREAAAKALEASIEDERKAKRAEERLAERSRDRDGDHRDHDGEHRRHRSRSRSPGRSRRSRSPTRRRSRSRDRSPSPKFRRSSHGRSRSPRRRDGRSHSRSHSPRNRHTTRDDRSKLGDLSKSKTSITLPGGVTDRQPPPPPLSSSKEKKKTPLKDDDDDDPSDSSNSGDEKGLSKGVSSKAGSSKGSKKSSHTGEIVFFAREAAIPLEVESFATMLLGMDQVCTAVAYRAAALVEAVVKLLPQDASDDSSTSKFASYFKTVSTSGFLTSASGDAHNLDKMAAAVVSGLSLVMVRRILHVATADIPIMAFSAANAVILGAHDPSLPKVASKDNKLVECSSRTTFPELALYMTRWARVVNLVDAVYGSAINGLTCVAIELHIGGEAVMVIYEYIQILKKLSNDGGEHFYSLFFTLQSVHLQSARHAVSEKARVKAATEPSVPTPPPPPKTAPAGSSRPKNPKPWVGGQHRLTENPLTPQEQRDKSCHGYNYGNPCSEIPCKFPHVCKICLSTSHGKHQCDKKAKRDTA